jgi:predicted  nucleic acid-binding Zn-ribbon protein
MGPTNVALVRLSQADQQLRASRDRLDAATKNVRVQERRVNDLREKLQQAQSQLKEKQARSGTLDLDLKSREGHIEKLRTQQQNTTSNKEYQALLIGINTEKVDRNKVEEELLKVMEAVEQGQKSVAELSSHLESEQGKLETMKQEIGGRIAELQAEIDQLAPQRDEAAASVPAAALVAFERLADRFDGEAMAAISKPDKRREEYICGACHMSLVVDVYNRLHVRNELVFCPSCQRILYIPQELPPEQAVHKPKEKRERASKAPAAAVGRQTSASDVLRSITVEEDAAPEAAGGAGAGENASPGEAANRPSGATPPEATST